MKFIKNNKYFKVEKAILLAFLSNVKLPVRDVIDTQLERISKVQRILEMVEIDFYVTKLFRLKWPKDSDILNKAEFEAFSIVWRVGTEIINSKIFFIGGRILSIENSSPIKKSKN